MPRKPRLSMGGVDHSSGVVEKLPDNQTHLPRFQVEYAPQLDSNG